MFMEKLGMSIPHGSALVMLMNSALLVFFRNRIAITVHLVGVKGQMRDSVVKTFMTLLVSSRSYVVGCGRNASELGTVLLDGVLAIGKAKLVGLALPFARLSSSMRCHVVQGAHIWQGLACWLFSAFRRGFRPLKKLLYMNIS